MKNDMQSDPGYSWRILAKSTREKSRVDLHGDGHSYFDELVIDNWLHLEQMDDDNWWLGIGPISIRIRPDMKDRKNCQIIIEDNESAKDKYLIRALGDFAKKYCLDEFDDESE